MMNAGCGVLEAGILEESHMALQGHGISPTHACSLQHGVGNHQRNTTMAFSPTQGSGKPAILLVDSARTQSNSPNAAFLDETHFRSWGDVLAKLGIVVRRLSPNVFSCESGVVGPIDSRNAGKPISKSEAFQLHGSKYDAVTSIPKLLFQEDVMASACRWSALCASKKEWQYMLVDESSWLLCLGSGTDSIPHPWNFASLNHGVTPLCTVLSPGPRLLRRSS